MIKDIRTSFRLLPYTVGFNSMMVCSILFVGLAFLLNSIWSFYYIPLAGMLFGQSMHSITHSTMVRSSPYKKLIETKFPVVVMGTVILICNTSLVIFYRILLAMNPEDEVRFVYSFLTGGVIIIAMMLYLAAAMKKFWPSTIVFVSICLPYAIFIAIKGEIQLLDMPIPNIDFWGSALCSYLAIVVGSVCSYAVNLLLYREEYAPQHYKKTLDSMKQKSGS